MPLDYKLCKVCMGKLIKNESEAFYTKFFGSFRDEMTSTFKELKKLITDVRTPAAPSGSPSPIHSPGSVASGSQEIMRERTGSCAAGEVDTDSSDSEKEEGATSINCP